LSDTNTAREGWGYVVIPMIVGVSVGDVINKKNFDSVVEPCFGDACREEIVVQ